MRAYLQPKMEIAERGNFVFASAARVAYLTAIFLLAGSAMQAAENAESVVSVIWQSTEHLRLPGVISAVVLEDSVCRAEVKTDEVILFGLQRGETVVYVWTKSERQAIIVRVIDKPYNRPPPQLSRAAREALGQGSVSSTASIFSGGLGVSSLIAMNRFDWAQTMKGKRFSLRGVTQSNIGSSASAFNLGSASVVISDDRNAISLLDFLVDTAGGPKARTTSFNNYNSLVLRGANIAMKRGANEYEVFAGTTIPGYFLNMSGTQGLAGFNFSRDTSTSLRLFSTTAATSMPANVASQKEERDFGLFQTLGASYRQNSLSLTGMVGLSNSGGMAQGGISYEGNQLSAFGSATASAREFPMNRLQLFYAGATSVLSGISYRLNDRVWSGIYFQHSISPPSGIESITGNSTNIAPTINVELSRRQHLAFTYTLQRSHFNGRTARDQITTRYQAALQSLFGRYANSIQLDLAADRDGVQNNAKGELTVRDVLTVPTRVGSFTFGLSHFRADPSTLARARANFSLLDPIYQQLIEANASGFDSSLLPASLQQLLDQFKPSSIDINAAASFQLGSKLNLTPSMAYSLKSQGSPGSPDRTQNYGYTLTYQINSSLQFQSLLTQTLVMNSGRTGLYQSRVLTFGVYKTLSRAPGFLSPGGNRKKITGRVYRDMNVNGAFNGGEPILAGIRVELEGHGVSITDSEGRFTFTRLSPGSYTVKMPIVQFASKIRVTSPTEILVELYEEQDATVNFGVVNFSRIVGNVFNDYAQDGKRQLDARGLQSVGLVLSGSAGEYTLQTDTNGEFELTEVLPGDYTLRLDPATLPANFLPPDEPLQIRVEPIKTVMVYVPVRAMRSISGRVLYQPAESDTTMDSPKPLAGVRLNVGGILAETDNEGKFVVRNLPAGNQMLSVTPISTPPTGIQIPEGGFKLAQEPTNLEGITIHIKNPAVLQYIVGP